MSVFHDAAWRQQEIPDAEPEPHDPDAEEPCERCGLPTLLTDLGLTATGSCVCPSCWFRSYKLPPLPEAS